MSTMGYVTTLTGAEDSATVSLDFEDQKYQTVDGGVLTTKTFPDLVTVARSTSGGRYGSTGLYETVAPNMPRFDYDPITKLCRGILVEPATTNLALSSEYIAASSGTISTPNVTTSPSGLFNANLITETATSGEHFTRDVSTRAVTGETWSWSVFVKDAPGEERALYLRIAQGGGQVVRFTPRTKKLSSSVTSGFEELPDGWFRVWMTVTVTITTNLLTRLQLNKGTAATYAGDGVSGLYMWGQQLEKGPLTSYLPAPATFTSRASTGTYFDERGVLKTVGSNVARYGYQMVNGKWVSEGLIIEGASTNLLKYSEEFNRTNWVPSNATVSVNSAVAPDGTTTADTLVESTAKAGHNIDQQYTGTLVAGKKYCYSYFFKAAGRTRIRLRSYYGAGGAGGFHTDFNLTTKAVTYKSSPEVVAGVIDAGNGWLRCWMTVVINLPAEGRLLTRATLLGPDTAYTGDGVSGVHMWGAQLELGTYPTSYIQTTASQATRAADVSTSAQVTRAADDVTVNNVPSWINQSAGTIYGYAQPRAGTKDGNKHAISLQGPDPSNWMSIRQQNGSYQALSDNTSGSAVVAVAGGTVVDGEAFKAALRYKNNDAGLSVNGGAVGKDTDCLFPTVTPYERVLLGSYASGGRYSMNGWIKSFRYFKEALSDAQLQIISQ